MLAEAVGIGSVSYRAATLGEAISLLKSHHPRIATHLFDDAGAQRRHVLLFLNDRDTRWLDNPDEPLADGDRLSIVQAISGG
ncbi:MAG: MoaD/ThiS family protein [Burkholderiales bacterium]|nr:MoaD/ThiS family protein [Phycisphaerae bacterium]